MRIFAEESRSAEENMLFDALLLEQLDLEEDVSVHFYAWQRPSITYGHFVRPEDYLNLQQVKALGIDLAKRPTGGGLVFHMWDMAFAVVVPKRYMRGTLENYFFINEAVRLSVMELIGEKVPVLIPDDMEALDSACSRFCMARPTKYDVVLQGKKIAGAAQRKTKAGFLHQGTIALQRPCEDVLDAILLPENRIKEAMYAHTFPLMDITGASKKETEHALRSLFCHHLAEVL